VLRKKFLQGSQGIPAVITQSGLISKSPFRVVSYFPVFHEVIMKMAGKTGQFPVIFLKP
jgi:hypothetical protein